MLNLPECMSEISSGRPGPLFYLVPSSLPYVYNLDCPSQSDILRSYDTALSRICYRVHIYRFYGRPCFTAKSRVLRVLSPKPHHVVAFRTKGTLAIVIILRLCLHIVLESRRATISEHILRMKRPYSAVKRLDILR